MAIQGQEEQTQKVEYSELLQEISKMEAFKNVADGWSEGLTPENADTMLVAIAELFYSKLIGITEKVEQLAKDRIAGAPSNSQVTDLLPEINNIKVALAQTIYPLVTNSCADIEDFINNPQSKVVLNTLNVEKSLTNIERNILVGLTESVKKVAGVVESIPDELTSDFNNTIDQIIESVLEGQSLQTEEVVDRVTKVTTDEANRSRETLTKDILDHVNSKDALHKKTQEYIDELTYALGSTNLRMLDLSRSIDAHKEALDKRLDDSLTTLEFNLRCMEARLKILEGTINTSLKNSAALLASNEASIGRIVESKLNQVLDAKIEEILRATVAASELKRVVQEKRA